MAVYTAISAENLSSLIDNYNIGTIKNYEGILEGVENTNYKITTSKKTYILTIFEKRVKDNELPFFIELQNYLSYKNIKCPQPIADQSGKYINSIKNKKCVIMSFLEGKKLTNPTPDHCYQVGKELAKMHQNTKDFSLKRQNSLHQSHWKEIFDKCKNIEKNNYYKLFDPMQKELEYLEKNWPENLPNGVIHADVFKDNVFFIENTLSGLIDFYFACNDFYAYELAISINAWCFDNKGNFNQTKYTSILKGYETLKKLTLDEIKNLPILMRGAAMRFLLTRLHDLLYHPDEAFVTPKDPLEYFTILKFHQLQI